ncbi:MAG: hypothetical protein H6611_09170 [Ignavibacteriales bacterium]|nr:hypothetical protein [Ignavibacteriales bacterium]
MFGLLLGLRRYDDYYIGWAPLPPYARFDRRSGIYFSIKWNSGYNYWNFVKYNHFTSVNIHNYYIYGSKVKNIYTRTKYRTNYYTENNRIVNGGVSRDFVEKRINRKITTRDINFSDRNFDTKDLRIGKEIRKFRPSDNDAKRSSNVDRTKITKGRELKSLNNDRVVIKRSTDKATTTDRTLNKTDNSKSSKTVNREVIKKSTTKENSNVDVNRSNNRTINKATDVKKEVKKNNSSVFRNNNPTNYTTPKTSVSKKSREIKVKREAKSSSKPETSVRSEDKKTSRGRN